MRLDGAKDLRGNTHGVGAGLLRKLGAKKVGAGGTALKLSLFYQLVGLIQSSGSHSLQTKSPQLDIA